MALEETLMFSRLFPLLSAFVACTGAAPTDAAYTGSVGADTGEHTDTAVEADTSDTGAGNVDWRAIGAGEWISEHDSFCSELVAAIVVDVEQVEPWFHELNYVDTSGTDAPDSLVENVDWASEVVVLGAIQCVNTGKRLRVMSVYEADATLAVEFELFHPELDGSILTTYWSAATVPAELAGRLLVTTLTEVREGVE